MDWMRSMQRKLTISVDAAVYEGLHAVIGRRHISRFLSDLARPYVTPAGLDEGYRAKAAEGPGEREALEWSEALIHDIAHDGHLPETR
jgi:hypothetical protein